jgi:predicted NBD/HSP70 family sugar kinase
MMRATVRDLRRVSRAAILRPLFLDGPQNRIGLARLTGLSTGSVTNVVGELLQEGLVVEVGREDSAGGRPRVQLRLNPDFGLVIGVDVGETGVRVEAFDLWMTEVAVAVVDVHPQEHGAQVVVEQVSAAVNELKARLEGEGRRILGVGIGVPGVVEHGGDQRVNAPSVGWRDVPLGRQFRERIELPVALENGAKTLGQAEMWLGAGRGFQHTIVTLWATGIGAAIFVDGALYRGSASSAGEWGHTNAVVDGVPCRCGARGCLEAYVGAEALLRQWARADPSVGLPAEPDQPVWLGRLVAAVEAGDGPARAVLDGAALHFGTAVANLVNLFNPERIVLSGWAGLELGPLLLTRVREIVAAQALDYAARRVTIELGRLGIEAVALGASTLVVEELLAAGGRPPERLGATARGQI